MDLHEKQRGVRAQIRVSQPKPEGCFLAGQLSEGRGITGPVQGQELPSLSDVLASKHLAKSRRSKMRQSLEV